MTTQWLKLDHMKFVPRNLVSKLQKATSDSPVLLLNGARQVGKSTLMQSVLDPAPRPAYFTFDDVTTLASAQLSPQSFLQGLPNPAILDEIQRAPELFVSLKQEVDKRRVPGRFLLTGSANVLMLPKLSESLAGRMDLHTLWPLSYGETIGSKETFIDWSFTNEQPPPLREPLKESTLIEALLRGGYPEALARDGEDSRNDWFRGYLSALLQRDVRDLSNVEQLTSMPDLLSLVAARPGAQLNAADLSRSVGLPNTTLKRYLALLEKLFLVITVRPWSGNLSKRLVKSPKLYLNDTGLLCYLLAADAQTFAKNRTLFGAVLENFVTIELAKQLGWARIRARMYHFRTSDGHEVDLILESNDGRLVGIEVKSNSDIRGDAFKGLRTLKDATGNRFFRGIVLYTGSTTVSFGPDLIAMPISALWQVRSLERGYQVSGFRLGMPQAEFLMHAKRSGLPEPQEKPSARPDLVKILAFSSLPLFPDVEWAPEFSLLKHSDHFRLFSAQGRILNSSSTDSVRLFEDEFGQPVVKDELGFKWRWGESSLRLTPDAQPFAAFFHDELNQDWHKAGALPQQPEGTDTQV